MKNEHKIALKTLGIKARVSNKLRKDFYNLTDNDFEVKYKGKKKLSNDEKVKYFDELFKEVKLMHSELNSYKEKRKYKAFINKLRLEKSQK